MSVQLSSKVLTSSYICAFVRRQVDIMSFCESSKVLESLHVCAGVSVQRDVSIIIYYLPVQTPETWHHHMYVKVYIFKKKNHHKNIVSVHDPIFYLKGVGGRRRGSSNTLLREIYSFVLLVLLVVVYFQVRSSVRSSPIRTNSAVHLRPLWYFACKKTLFTFQWCNDACRKGSCISASERQTLCDCSSSRFTYTFRA